MIFESSKVGSRPATRVRIAAPQGSRYDGCVGVVVRIVGGTLFVRFSRDARPLPFGIGEVQAVRR